VYSSWGHISPYFLESVPFVHNWILEIVLICKLCLLHFEQMNSFLGKGLRELPIKRSATVMRSNTLPAHCSLQSDCWLVGGSRRPKALIWTLFEGGGELMDFQGCLHRGF
jgi:hypothetical protein